MVSQQESPSGTDQLRRDFALFDLVTLSLSSIGPVFSVMAAGAVLLVDSGGHVIWLIGLAAIPFVSSSFIFRLLNQHFPDVGASYHWCRKVLGVRMSRFQSWIIVVAYFVSIPPIILPAANYTLGLLRLNWDHNRMVLTLAISAWVMVVGFILTRRSGVMARVTTTLLALELVGVLILVTTGIIRWPVLHVATVLPPVRPAGIFAALVISATIMDGWEIDSYASGESKRPLRDPGIAAIIGLSAAVCIYMALFWLMAHELPHVQWAQANPFQGWTRRLDPGMNVVGIIAALASTVGSLWLTTFILARALFVMGRDGLLPRELFSVNRQGTPSYAITVILIPAWLVVIAEIWTLSLARIIGVVLAIAGFFLIMEFFLDSLTATVFLLKRHQTLLPHHAFHGHQTMKFVAIVTTGVWIIFLVGFLWYGPRMVSPSIDWVIGIVLVVGLLFALTDRRTTQEDRRSRLTHS